MLEEHALFCTLSSQLLNAIANFLPQDNQSFDEIDAQKLSNFRIYADFSKAIKEIYEMAHVYFQARRSLHMDSRSRIVHVVNSYIKENLSKDLSMVVLGDYVGLNPAYLSRIYKETAGQSINSYISDQRTVLAKKLLKDPTIKIQKIAEMTGKKHMSAQAVGGAVGHNPISILIPCHRVVGTNGSLTGYAGGIEKKIGLLKLEQTDMSGMFVPKRGTAL